MTTSTTTVAEWVLPGHPDKLCDALADRIVGEALRADPQAQCGIEVACAFDHVFVTGLVGHDAPELEDVADRVAGWARDTWRSAGYGGRWTPRPQALQVDVRALRVARRGPDWQELRHLSDDQCICVGHAQDTPQSGYLPGALWTARRIAQALHRRQQAAPQGDIGPDGKVIVEGVDDEDGRFVAREVSVSLHHAEQADWLALRRHAEGALADALGDAPRPDLVVNAAGMFLCGGPDGDNGTTGKKLVMDAYGPAVPIGGGAWSGKDFHKPDRAGGMLARRMALQAVRAGLGRRVRVQLAYRPNSTAPQWVDVEVDGRRLSPSPALALTLVATRDLARAVMADLRARDFAPLCHGDLARWGHFGTTTRWWESPP